MLNYSIIKAVMLHHDGLNSLLVTVSGDYNSPA